jgi:dienelactone hydrolase
MTGYSEFSFKSGAFEKIVFVKGAGPGVLLMHELPGMVRECVALADHIAAQGFTVFMPLLFGEANVTNSNLRTLGYFAQICVRREISLFAAESDSPLTTWLRALAREVRIRCPQGKGIGVIGMCLTGGFVINLMLEDSVLAPVACQPSLPFKTDRRALGVSPETLRAAKARSAQVPLLCYRFEGDRISPKERYERLQQEFGPAFEGHVLPGDHHATLTIDLVEDARARVVQFFKERLT